MPDKTGLWGALGTPRAVRVISVMMLAYLLVLGGLVVGYTRVSGCLASYADRSARSTAARADAAAQDRQLNDRERALDDSDRDRYREDQRVLTDFLDKLTDPQASREDRAKSLASLQTVYQETKRTLSANEKLRDQIRAERAKIEKDRAGNPVPPAPSESC